MPSRERTRWRAAWLAAPALAALWLLWAGTRSQAAGLLWERWSVVAFAGNVALSWLVIGLLVVRLPPGPARPRAIAFAAATLTLAVCVALCELPTLFGHDYSLTFRTNPDATIRQLQASVNRPDPELIHVHWPNAEFEGEVVGNLVHFGVSDPAPYSVRLQYDASGFRNDRDLERAEVVAIGDSFVEAALVPRERTVTERLARRLGTPVANLGQSGYGFRQELAVLRRFGLPLEPRLVLWFLFGGNDFRDVEAYEQALAQLGRETEPLPLRKRSFVRNALLSLSRLTSPARIRPEHLAYFRRADGVRDAVLFGQATERPTQRQWQVGVETLSAARALARDAGAELAIVYIPRKFEIYQGLLEIPDGSFVADWRDVRLNERVAAWAADQGIPFIDTTPALRREAEAGSHPYLLDDVHWNARGHRIAAETIRSWYDSWGTARISAATGRTPTRSRPGR